MDQDTKKALEEIRDKQNLILRVLIGDAIDPKAPDGVVQKMGEHEVILKGCPEEKRLGLIEMVQALWEGRNKALAIFSVITVISASLPWLVPLLAKIIHLKSP